MTQIKTLEESEATQREAGNGQPLLEVRNLKKSFGNKEILKSVSFDVNKGEALVLIGPSGSGKTTVLRCLNFLETPNGGSIRLGGEYLGGSDESCEKFHPVSGKKLAVERRSFGFVFQRFNLFSHLTALQNVMIGPMRVLGRPKAEARDLAVRELERVHLGVHKDKRPSELSGGQQQRVAIARALAMKPRMMLFDEPTSALDPELVSEVLDVMRAIALEGMTMMLVTHELAFARQVANRIMFMMDGRIVEEGPPAQIFSEPREEATRKFLSHFHSR